MILYTYSDGFPTLVSIAHEVTASDFLDMLKLPGRDIMALGQTLKLDAAIARAAMDVAVFRIRIRDFEPIVDEDYDVSDCHFSRHRLTLRSMKQNSQLAVERLATLAQAVRR